MSSSAAERLSSEIVGSRGAGDWFRAKLVELLPRLKAVALLYCGNVHDAEDAVQTTCVLALERSHQWTGVGPLDHWLIKILVNTCHSDQRRRAVRAGPPLDTVPEPPDESTAELEDQQYLDEVGDAVMRLPPEARDVLLLVIGEGLPYRAAAATLGIPIGTVMSRIARARTALKDRFSQIPHGSRLQRQHARRPGIGVADRESQ